jgi:Fe2+ or Zn2+ uptake regulation protein
MDHYLGKLRKKGFKITAKRRMMIELFLRKKKYFTPEEMRKELTGHFSSVSLPSIYRNFESMEKIGLLTRIIRPDRRLYYGLCRVKDDRHHHHIICVKCGRIGELERCDLFGDRIINGFRITGHYLQLEGVCPKCG